MEIKSDPLTDNVIAFVTHSEVRPHDVIMGRAGRWVHSGASVITCIVTMSLESR